ncbi:sirohydrochlorin cobaltochelatase [Clostridium sp. D2Q-11]|uniref:Sirohydrochlorin cobaltochelatase n=1 Tax=Anaeromonas frigoriresistens TaxID=2683708 RepID=A0A942URJ9_9FIRM|nr:sirohydrochlorin cobaltochelatase [Anaeromonas frigoriresistens]
MKIIENINNKFKEYDVILGFTSEIIINRLKEKKGIKIYLMHEALDQIKKDKYKEVIVQPLHLIAGLEYEKIVQVSSKYEEEFDKIEIGKPVFIEAKDYDNIVNIIVSKFKDLDDNKGIVLMGHGSKNFGNISYKKLQNHI